MGFKILFKFAVMGSLLISFVWSGAGFAQEKKIYTLEESIAEAFSDNTSLKAIKEKVYQSIQVKKQARADFFPKLSTTYAYNRQSEARTFRSTLMAGQDIAVSAQDNYEWKGTVTQPLFTGFSLISSFRLAELGMDSSKIELDLAKMNLALQVKEAYFNILIADKTVDVAQKEVESLESNVNVSRSFYNVGMIPINDLLKVEVELGNARQNLVKALNLSRLARAQMNTVLSRPINASLDVEDVLGYKPEKGEFEAYLQEALKNRPEIKNLDINLKQVEQQIRLVRSSNYPQVSLTYDYIKEGDDARVDGSPFHDAGSWQATAVLSWRFWEWGKTYYSVKEKEGVRNELVQTRNSLKEGISLELKNAFLDLQTAEENIPTTRKAVEQGEENLRVNEERYKAQVSTITDVLDAQTLLTRARVNYYTALYTHHLARARLERAQGKY